jgi:hypothetical protein
VSLLCRIKPRQLSESKVEVEIEENAHNIHVTKKGGTHHHHIKFANMQAELETKNVPINLFPLISVHACSSKQNPQSHLKSHPADADLTDASPKVRSSALEMGF